MRLHVTALPHTDVTRAFDWCAYTAKVRRLGAMLHAKGHEMFLYSSADYDAECTHVQVITDEDRQRWFGGEWDHSRVFDRWDTEDASWIEMGRAAIAAIRNRIMPGDAIGVIAGRCQAPIADAFPNHLALEWGVGYVGVLDNSLRVFESLAHRNYVSGFYRDDTGRFFDAVIPNAFDPADLPFNGNADDYLLYLGRPTERKGLEVVRQLARRHRVVTAGQGEPWCEGAEHAGIVLGDEKAKLLGGARAALVPTFYLEPFGGVAVEAMMCGTPAITTDFGAFPETVHHGWSGYRCNTLGEFITAADRVDTLHRDRVREWAMQFSTHQIAGRYDDWIRRCDLLHRGGWYDGQTGGHE